MPELDSNSNPLSRVELLRVAQGLGVVDADVMTRAELRAAIDKAQRPERPTPEHHPATWVSVARRLLASVVERGLNLPDAAALIRGDTKLMAPPIAPPPVATVTLARIYAAQGHLDRAIGTIDEVLESDPDHELARDLRTQLAVRRAELAGREVTAAARAADAGAESSSSNGHAAVAPEPERAPEHAQHVPPSAPAEEPVTAPEPPLVASVDAAAELVAPSFDTVERQAAHSDLSPFPTEPPTLVGVVALELETLEAADATESEPPATLSAGLDWQLENESAASTELIPEAETSLWAAASADTGDAVPGADEAPPAALPAEPSRVESAVATAAAAADGHAADAVSAVDAGSNAAAFPGAEAPASSHATNGVTHGVAAVPASAPPSTPDSAPHSAPSAGADAAAAPGAAAACPSPLPRAPGLLLIETDTPIRYIYWELAAAGSPHWIHVVTHTPTGRGDTERRERRFPVQRELGALRLEGVPRQAVVRAMLTHAPDDVRPLVVAGAVRPRGPASGDTFEVRYAPHGKAEPEALAGRARPLLERANPIYWDG
jgi:hypothetical protein